MLKLSNHFEFMAGIVKRIAASAGAMDFSAGINFGTTGRTGINIFVGPRRNRQSPHATTQPNFFQFLAEKGGMSAGKFLLIKPEVDHFVQNSITEFFRSILGMVRQRKANQASFRPDFPGS